jgi:hypothetical protein
MGGILDLARRFGEPPVPQLVANSLILGIEVAGGIVVLGWIIRPDDCLRSPRKAWLRWIRPVTQPPPLLLAAGVLALPWLAGLTSRWAQDARRPSVAGLLANVSSVFDPYRDPRIVLAASVGLALAPRLLSGWHGEPAPGRPSAGGGTAFDAALVAGASQGGARRLSAPRRLAVWVGRFVLVWALAATNLTPSLLLSPWSDHRTAVPGALVLAGGVGEAPVQAAALAVLAVTVNVGAIALARLTSALPRYDDFQ